MNESIEKERTHRRELLTQLRDLGGPKGVNPSVLRKLGIYGGAQGVWVDKARTSDLTEDGFGVTVGLLHTGSSYQDDISEDAVLYHYPDTQRLGRRDNSEIEATKNAKKFHLPVFVITYPTPSSSRRDVRLGWVEEWDDRLAIFLITFSESSTVEVQEETPFNLTDKASGSKTTTTQTRPGQMKFKFDCLARYGQECAVCGINVKEMLDAAHIYPKENNGSDDPRNGLILCASHHRAFDAGLFKIHPETLDFHFKDKGSKDLKITCKSLQHLPSPPHPEALRWHWKECKW